MINSLLTKNEILKVIQKLNADKDFEKTTLFIYTDGVNWGYEVFGNTLKDKDEANIAHMWWDQAHRILYHIDIENREVKFSTVISNPQDSQIIEEILIIDTKLSATIDRERIINFKKEL